MSVLDDIAAIDEDALVMWDKAQIEFPEGIKLQLHSFFGSFSGVLPCVGTRARDLVVWVPSAKQWVVRRVYDWQEILTEGRGFNDKPYAIELHREFCERVDAVRFGT